MSAPGPEGSPGWAWRLVWPGVDWNAGSWGVSMASAARTRKLDRKEELTNKLYVELELQIPSLRLVLDQKEHLILSFPT